MAPSSHPLPKSLLFLGVGNMGGAILSSILSKNCLQDTNIILIEPREEAVSAFLSKRENISHVRSSSELDKIFKANALLIAVKPQASSKLCAGLTKHLTDEAEIISVMAGRSLTSTKQDLNEAPDSKRRYVRAMPNLPLSIQKGVTTIYSESSPSYLAETIFSSGGETVSVESEKLIDAATAISGSGPGFTFHLLQGAIEAARELGFSEVESKALVANTAQGALELYLKSEKDLSELEAQVTSKRGTTEAGISALQSKDAKDTVKNCIIAAYNRALELHS